MLAHKGRPPAAVEVARCVCFNAGSRAQMAIAPGRSKKRRDKAHESPAGANTRGFAD
jgi:hypothetical protein